MEVLQRFFLFFSFFLMQASVVSAELHETMVCELHKKQRRSYRWPFPWVVCFLPVGMSWFCERGVVITCAPGTAPVGKQVYFYREGEEREREIGKGFS